MSTSDRLISRTHFARFLVERGHAASTRAVVQALTCVAGKPGYVAHAWAPLARRGVVDPRRRRSGRARASGALRPDRDRHATAARRAYRDARRRCASKWSPPSHTLRAEYATFAATRVLRLARLDRLGLPRPGRESARPRRTAAAAHRGSRRCGRGGSHAGSRATSAPCSSSPTARASPRRCSATACSRSSTSSTSSASRIPFVDSPERVPEAIRTVNDTAAREAQRPLVISSVVDEAMSEVDPPRGPTRSRSTCSRSSSSRWKRSSAPRARTPPGARTASPTATSISRGWRRSTSRRRTTTARRRATSTRRR